MVKPNSPFTWEADNNLLRQSFARIVSTTSAPTGQFYNQAPPALYTKPSFSGSLPVGAFQHNEMFSSDSEAGLTRMYSVPQRAPSFTDYRAFQQAQQAQQLKQFQQQQLHQQQQQLEAQRLQQQKQLQAQQIQQQQQQRPPQQSFCATCASCKTCAPLRQNSAFQNINVFDPLGLSYNYAPAAPSNQPGRTLTPPTSSHNSQTLPRTVSGRQTNSMPASVLKKSSTLPASSSLTSKEKLLQEFDRRRQQQFDTMSMTSTQSASIEYEKWKQRHGISTGRQMKKGLNKLQYAFDY